MITEYLICDQFFLAFNGIEGLLVQGKASVFFNNSKAFYLNLVIHNAAQKLNELQTFITHNYALLNINNVLPPNLYMKSKQEISEWLIDTASQNINRTSNPISQFVYLWNQAVSLYGSMMMKALGFSSLIKFYEKVITNFSEAYVNSLTDMSIGKHDDVIQYYSSISETIKRIAEAWMSLLSYLPTWMIDQSIEIDNERSKMIEDDIKNIYKADSHKTLVLINNQQVAYICSQMIQNIKFFDNSNNQRNINCVLFAPLVSQDEKNTHKTFRKNAEAKINYETDPNIFSFDLAIFIDLLETIVFEKFLFHKNEESVTESSNDFSSKKCNIMVSTIIEKNLMNNPNTKVLVVDQDCKRFSWVYLHPAVLAKLFTVTYIRTSDQEIVRKVKRIDNMMR